jgi:putative tryptophan/tyrosine transport system substrate-binding protein
MNRRQFIPFLGGAAAALPLIAHAQQTERMRRIGVLMSTAASDAEGKLRVQAFMDSLKRLGWIEDQNVHLDYRWGAADAALTRRFAQEIVALKPDVILSQNTAAVPPLLEATKISPRRPSSLLRIRGCSTSCASVQMICLSRWNNRRRPQKS